MRIATRALDDRKTTVVVLIALVAPIVFVGAMYWHSHRTERLRQATADAALHDYASVAAWQLSKRLDDAFHQDVMRRLGPAAGAGAGAGAAHMHCSDCDRAQSGRFLFESSSSTLRWANDSGATDTTYQRALAVVVARELERPVEEPHRIVFASVAGRARTIMLVVPSNGTSPTVGIDLDSTAMVAVVNRVLERGELLPRSLVRPPFGPRELFVRLTRSDGTVMFENAPAPTSLRLAGYDGLGAAANGLAVTVDLRPALAEKLLIGANSRSTTGVFALLIALSMLLAGAAIVQLRRSRELARMRTRFVANVSHELRTPLAHISMFAETLMLARERSEGERRHFATVIFRESRRLSTLVESVLRFARAEAGRATLQVEPRELVSDVADAIAAFDPIARAASMSISTDDMADVTIIADAGALRQILLNLLDNAVKYAREGQVIDVRASQRGSEVIVSVEDRGAGIPAEERERVFEPFVRLASGVRRTGTGIGLSVVRELMLAQDGRVWIEQREGGGTRVCAAFPAGQPTSSTVDETHADAAPV